MIHLTETKMMQQEYLEHSNAMVKAEDNNTSILNGGAAAPPKQEDFNAEMQEQRNKLVGGDLRSNPLIAKFTQLWFACYFERRLTRQKIQSADLETIITDLKEYI